MKQKCTTILKVTTALVLAVLMMVGSVSSVVGAIVGQANLSADDGSVVVIGAKEGAELALTGADADLAGTGYGSGHLYYSTTGENGSWTDASFTLTNGSTASVSIDASGMDISNNDKIYCSLKLDNDYFSPSDDATNGGNVNQGVSNWMNGKGSRGSGTHWTITITIPAVISFNILQVQGNNNPPSLQYSITDNVPDYYLVGNSSIAGTEWSLSSHTDDLTYNDATGYYEITKTNLAVSTTYNFRLRSKNRSDWNNGNINWDSLTRPVTDASGLVNTLESEGTAKNIQFTVKAAANLTIAYNEATSKIIMTFTPTSCTVTTGSSPAGVGTVTVNGSATEATVAPGTSVSLAATPVNANEYVFSKWQNSTYFTFANQNAASTTATVTGSAMATAVFVKKSYTVTCNTAEHGSISTASDSYAWGETVTVTVTPDSGYKLSSLSVNSGAVTVVGNTFEMPKANATVTATFEELVNHTINFDVCTGGGGYVSVGYQYGETTNQITQSISDNTAVLEGENLNFCAIPQPGYKFDGWYTASSGGTLIAGATQDHTYTVASTGTSRYAKFSELAYKPEENKIKVLVSKSPVDAGCNLLHYWKDGQAGTDATIEASPSYTNVEGVIDPNSAFCLVTIDWTSTDKLNCAVHNNDWNPKTKDLNDPQLEKGNTYIIQWGGSGEGTGGAIKKYDPASMYPVSLNVTNPEKASDTHVAAYATLGSEVTVTATPADDTKKISVLTVNSNDIISNKKFTATSTNPDAVQVTYADKQKYTVNFGADSSGGGTVTATAGGAAIESGDLVLEGKTVTFTAVPSKNYVFDKWDDNSTTATRTVTVAGATTVTASFKDITYDVVIGSGTVQCTMKKLDNGTWISTATVPSDYWISIRRNDGSGTYYYSHSGVDNGDAYQLNWLAADNTVTGKMNGRWYDTAPSGNQLYKSDNTKAFYVVFDPDGIVDKNGYKYNANCSGRFWFTTNEDGLYPATVYLKSGTVRDDGGNNAYFTTAMNGETTLESEGTTAGLTATGITDKYKKTIGATTYYFVKKVVVPTANLRSGAQLHIKTQTRDLQFDSNDASKGNAKDYYVKGFDVNGGLTYAILNQEFNDNDQRTEKASYADYDKIHGTDTNGCAWNDFTLELKGYCDEFYEVTPIYTKIAAKSTDNVRLYAEEFAGKVKENWRGSLAVYPYIESTYDPFGSYPGQLMVNDGGRYMIDIPAAYVNGSGVSTPVQGLTMNNYIFDDVHNDLFFSDVSNRSDAHYQTYDYDEFEIINKIFVTNDLDEDIVFCFKYRETADLEDSNLAKKVDGTVYKPVYYRDNKALYDRTHTGNNYPGQKESSIDYSYEGGTYHAYDYRTLVPTLDITDTRYGFEPLADFYGNRVDIMGNLVDVKGNEEKAAYNPIYIVSNGYDYGKVGKYATAWAYYMPMKDDGSAAWTGEVDHYGIFEVMGGQGILGTNNDQTKFGSQSYLIDPDWPLRIKGKYTNQLGVAEILDCENVPCIIAYEHEIKGDQSNLKRFVDPDPGDEEGTNMAYRSDGRWYFSNSDSLIAAHTGIAIVDASGNYVRDYYQAGNIDHTKAGYDATINTGINTGIKAFFTNSGTETVEGREITNTYGTTVCNSISDGEHTYNMKTIGDAAGKYEFVGWYMKNGNDYILASEDAECSQEAKSNDFFVAVYREVPTGNVNITHVLNEDSTGTATCIAQAEVLDSSDVVQYSTGFVANPKVGPSYIKENVSDKLRITLKTTIDQFSTFGNFQEAFTDTASHSIRNLTQANVQTLLATSTVSSVTTEGLENTIVITIPIAKLFNSSSQEQIATTLNFYSLVDLTTYKYDFTYQYQAYNPGTMRYFKVAGIFTKDELNDYMTINSSNLVFANEDAKVNFLNMKAPYEDNFMQEISWLTSGVETTYNSGTKTITVNSDNGKILASNVNIDATNDPDAYFTQKISLTARLPYAFDKNNNYAPTGVTTVSSVTGIAKTDTTAALFTNLDVFKLFSFNSIKKATDIDISDPVNLRVPSYLTAPLIVINGDTPEYFRYWTVKAAASAARGETEYTRCYSPAFNFSLFQNTVIEPVYTPLADGETIEITGDSYIYTYDYATGSGNYDVEEQKNLDADSTGVTIRFLENSRNQTNVDASGNTSNFDHVYTDFLLNFNSVAKDTDGKTPIKLNKLDPDTKKVGLIIEAVNWLDEDDENGGYITDNDSSYYSEKYGNTISNEKKTALESFIAGTSNNKLIKSEFDATKLDNKNCIQYYYSLVNKKLSSDKFILNNNNKIIYRAYAYIKDNNNTNIQISAPVYFTIYDIANMGE